MDENTETTPSEGLVTPKNEATFNLVTQSNNETQTDEWKILTLESVLTLATLENFQSQLRPYVGQQVQMDAEQVERIDTAALQLLLAFIRTQGTVIRWIKPPSVVCETGHLLGLSTLLNCPQ